MVVTHIVAKEQVSDIVSRAVGLLIGFPKDTDMSMNLTVHRLDGVTICLAMYSQEILLVSITADQWFAAVNYFKGESNGHELGRNTQY